MSGLFLGPYAAAIKSKVRYSKVSSEHVSRVKVVTFDYTVTVVLRSD